MWSYLWSAGWSKLQVACDAHPEIDGIRCPAGQSRITESFDFKARGIDYIIHAVGPDCHVVTDMPQQDALLAGAYTSALELADRHQITSLAFPFISSAIYAFPKERAARMALDSIYYYCRKNSCVKDIYYSDPLCQDNFLTKI